MTKSVGNGTSTASYKYSLAADSEVPLDKADRTCCKKCALGGCVIGLILVVSAVIVAFIMKPIVNRKIEDEMVLFEGGKAFLGWKDPPVNPVMKVFFFNLTNEEAFISGREKPRVEKCGPYVYVERIHKVNISFDDLGESVRFSDKKYYYFDPLLSNGSENDTLIMPNLPMFGAFRKLGDKSTVDTTINAANFINPTKTPPDTKPFLRLSVLEFLWGYPSLLISLKEQDECIAKTGGINILENPVDDDDDDWDWDEEENVETEPDVKPDKCKITADNMHHFGFYLGINGTVRNMRTLRTGKNDISRKGEMISFQGNQTLGFWNSSESCNVIAGRDPGTLSIGLDKTKDLELYFANMCRGMKFQYRKTVTHAGIESWRFLPAEDTFHNPQDNPDNRCYCRGPTCLPNGIFDIGDGCKADSPVYMSWPHFQHGDPVLRERVDGVEPARREEHEFYLDIEPHWGATLSAHAAFQFNVLVDRNSYSGFEKIEKRVVLPFLMLEEGVSGPNQIVSTKMEMLLTIADKVKNLMFLVLVTIGFICMLPEIVIWSKSCCCSSPGEK